MFQQVVLFLFTTTLFLIIFKRKLKKCYHYRSPRNLRNADMSINMLRSWDVLNGISLVRPSLLEHFTLVLLLLPAKRLRSTMIIHAGAETNCTLFSLAVIELEHMVIALIMCRTCSRWNYTITLTKCLIQ